MLIVTLGTGVFAGIKASSDDMLITADKYYRENNFTDISVISANGLTSDILDKIKKLDSVKEAEGIYMAEAVLSLEGRSASVRFMNLPESINKLTLIEGRMPEKPDECVILNSKKFNRLIEIGSTLTFEEITPMLNSQYKIVGIVESPEFISFELGSSTVGSGRLDYVAYTIKESFPILYLTGRYVQIAVKAENTDGIYTYSDKYQQIVSKAKNDISSILGETDNIYILDRSANIGYVSYEGDAEKISAISKIFPAFFFLVAALVCLTTMTRMVEEERTQIGTLKALGFGKMQILLKYVVYSLFATAAGCISGLLIGYNLFPRAIFSAYSIMYTLPDIETPFHVGLGLATSCAFLVCTEIFTIASCIKSACEVPAKLMQPRAPKPGKRIFIERIKPLWNHFSFIQKVTYRNIFRYKKRLFMTLVGIAGCTALTLAGFGLKNSIADIIEKQFENVMLYDFRISISEKKDFAETNIPDIMNKYGAEYIRYYEKYTDTYSEDGTMYNAYLLCPDIEENADDDYLSKFFSLHSRERNKKTQIHYPLTKDGVIITEKLSYKLGLNVGDKIGVSSGNGSRKYFTVSAIAENYVYNYIYILPSLYESAFGETPEFTICTGILSDGVSADSNSAKNMASEFLSVDGVTSITFKDNTRASFSDAIKSLNIVVVVLIVCAAALAIIVIYNLANINITERIREIATIKVLGFTDGEVTAYIFRESVVLTVLGIAAGFILGIWLHRFVITTAEVDIVMFGREIYPVSYLFAAMLTFGFSMLVNFAMHNRLKKVSMTDSLKSAE